MSFPFKIPFASTGEQTTVPDTSPDGFVNFTQGYTPDYKANPATDPNAKLVEMGKFNYLLNKITAAIGEIQRKGSAAWYSALAPYELNAEVIHAGKKWRSIIANNSSTPGVGSDWLDVTPGTVAKLNTGTGADDVPKNSDLGSASNSNVVQATGTSTTDVMSQKAVTERYGQPVNLNIATGAYAIDPSLPIGGRVLIRKVNATQGTVTITCTGHTFTRAALASVTLNSDGDFWLVEKVTSTRLELVDGFETGSNANGFWSKSASGDAKCSTIFTSAGTLESYIASLYTYTQAWTFPIAILGDVFLYGSGVDNDATGFVSGSNITSAMAFVRYFTRTASVGAASIRVIVEGRWY